MRRGARPACNEAARASWHEALGLHVKTVRGYVRDGRLKAVRIGKQYRIAAADLEEFTGHPVPAPTRETTRRIRHVEVSSIVQIDVISPAGMRRLTTTVMAAVAGRSSDDAQPRIETVYDEERGSLKIILLGDLGTVADLLKLIDTLAEVGE
jgi:excisionase family DNA binding protein